MRRLICSAFICAFAVCFGEPVCSSIGANHIKASAVEEPFDNPYVTDGLVAMFDGIYNAGWGMHKDDATHWKNLIDGKNAIWDKSNLDVRFDDTSLVIQDANGSMKCLDFIGDQFSVEYVFMLIDNNTSRECLFEACSHNSSFRYKAASYVEDFWNWGQNIWVASGKFFDRNGNIGVAHSIASTWRDIFSSNNHGMLYLDGQFLRNTGLAAPQNVKPLIGFQIGRPGISATTFQRIYAIRIYNRVLSPEEIQHNYNIDKERFGL